MRITPFPGIDPIAMAVVAELEDQARNMASESIRVDLSTYAWYNGRERCAVSLFTNRDKGGTLVCVYGTPRHNGSAIFLDVFQKEGRPFPDELDPYDDAYEKAYKERQGFDEGEIRTVVNTIWAWVDSWIGEPVFHEEEEGQAATESTA